jgi:hypothetical protein
MSSRFVLTLCLAVAALLYGVSSAGASSVVQGPFPIDNAAIAAAGMADLRNHVTGLTGFDQDGECFPAMRRWFVSAGGPGGSTGPLASGGHISVYTNAHAVTVAAADAQPGDVIQLENPGDLGGWPDGVHTAVIVDNNHDGTFHIVQSNAPGVYI